MKITNFKKIIVYMVQAFIFLTAWTNMYANYVIDADKASGITEKLSIRDYKVTKNGNIIINSQIEWESDYSLTLWTYGDIIFGKNGKITNKGNGSLYLKAGMEPGETKGNKSTIIFYGNGPQIELHGFGEVKVYYNPRRVLPTAGEFTHKYQNPNYNYFRDKIKTPYPYSLHMYMLINNVFDLEDIVFLLYANYALSQDIDASATEKWYNGKGFVPLHYPPERRSFNGNFDGNGYTIRNLVINRPEEDEVGLFGKCIGREMYYSTIENLHLKDFKITGKKFVGALAGKMIRYNIKNVSVSNSIIEGEDVIGGMIGSACQIEASSIDFLDMHNTTKI